jgi:hypothetical protein
MPLYFRSLPFLQAIPMKTSSHVVGALALFTLSSPIFADAPAYKADISFGQADMKSPPVAIAADAQDRIHVLLTDGNVLTYDATGRKTGGFKAEMSPAPTTITVSGDRIYLFNTLQERKEIEFRGKKVKRMVSNGVGCVVFDATGAKTGEMKLPEAASAADAHFIGKELAVGDLERSQIVFYDVSGAEPKVTRKIGKVFRLCCGIFDFCPGQEADTLVAANLGAFKVQTFKAGEKTTEFGARGEKPEEFRGCCNPVNVATLTDGSIITVEKSPTRVKIFAKDNQTCAKVTGLTELVEGCSTIPIAVDGKGSIYLASDTKKCVVKCVPGVSDKPEPPEPKEEEIQMPEVSPAMTEIIEKVSPLIEAKDFAKAKTTVDEIMKAHPEMPENEKVQVLLGISISPHMEKGDADAAIKALDEVLKAYPNSDLAKNAGGIRESIRESIEMMKAQGEEEAEGEAPAPAEKKPE